jgi:aryl-alcohol dehydrogenase-like predicted oxidoreductase
METRFVGRTGLQVSELCLGTMTFGADGGTDEATAHQILDAFVDAGGTFIDTANVYSQGVAEEILGRWLKIRNRDDLVIATKVYGEAAPGEPPRGTGRKHVLAEVEASLRRLQTDFIDLYQAHVFDAQLRSRRPSPPSTPWSPPGRPGSSGPATTPAGSCRSRSTCLGTMAGSRSSACSRSTTCSTAARSWSYCRSAATTASA